MNNHFVIDNSVVMTWCFQDEVSPYADAVLDSLKESVAIVPAIWPLEVINVLLVAEHKQKLGMVDRSWPERLMKDLLVIGRAHKLSSYDTAYLELAIRQGIPIATLDQRLLEAARQIDIPVLKI